MDCSSSLKGNFQFIPPQSVKVIGSYLLQSLAKPELNVDVAVEIPQVSSILVNLVIFLRMMGNPLFIEYRIISVEHAAS